MKIAIFLLAALTGILHAQGPLDPPAGPAPTMKSLDQIEPRTPISGLPFVITEPGSYYFTGNLVFTEEEGNAITIEASNVTLDLMGFTLSSTSSVTGSGIVLPLGVVGVNQHIAIRNGTIVGSTTVSKSGSPATWSVNPSGFNYSIYNFTGYAKFKDLMISGARKDGLYSYYSCSVENVHSTQNGENGISISSGRVTKSTTIANGGIGIFAPSGSVSSSFSSDNGGGGISTPSGNVSSSISSGNGGTGISALGGVVTSSTAKRNINDGISAGEGSVVDSHASDNGHDGIEAQNGRVSNSTAVSNGVKGISAFSGSVSGCAASNNGTNGIYASNGSVTNSTATANTEPDISASNAVVAFCRFTTFTLSNSSCTGNFPSK